MAETSQTKSSETRQRLMESAVKAFATKGFHATTTRDIAAGAGISPATLYFHHKSKEELLYLIALSGHQEILELVTQAASSAHSPRCQIDNLVKNLIINHAERNTLARVINYELGALLPENFATIRGIRRETEARLKKVILKGKELNEFSAEYVDIATVAIFSLGIDVSRWYRDGGPWTPHELANHYSRMTLLILGAQNAPSQCEQCLSEAPH